MGPDKSSPMPPQNYSESALEWFEITGEPDCLSEEFLEFHRERMSRKRRGSTMRPFSELIAEALAEILRLHHAARRRKRCASQPRARHRAAKEQGE